MNKDREKIKIMAELKRKQIEKKCRIKIKEILFKKEKNELLIIN